MSDKYNQKKRQALYIIIGVLYTVKYVIPTRIRGNTTVHIVRSTYIISSINLFDSVGVERFSLQIFPL